MQNPNEQGEDVFWGQVLSLHPLSGTIMLHYYDPKTGQTVSNAEYRAMVGGWLARAKPGDFDAADYDCTEYWEAVAAIMLAAREYRRLHERSLDTKRQARPGDATAAGNREAPLPEEELFDAYAHEQGLVCQDCGAPLAYERESRQILEDDAVTATFVCRSCNWRLPDCEVDLSVPPEDGPE